MPFQDFAISCQHIVCQVPRTSSQRSIKNVLQEQVHSVASRACQKIQEQLSTRKRQERYYEPNQSPNPNTQNNTSVYS